MAAGIIAYCIGRVNRTARDYFADAVAVIETGLFIWLALAYLGGSAPSFSAPYICGLGISLKFDGFRMLYGLIASFMWAMTTVFSREYMAHYPRTNRYYMFFLMTLGATAGVFLSADLFTTFLFFEIMSFTSYAWVAHDETKESLRAAQTYLAVAVIGGMVLLMGLFILYDIVGTLRMDEIYDALNRAVLNDPSVKGRIYAAGACMLTGFGAKAGMFPLHIWLPKAHPVAPAPASALLSGILTKSGVFGVLIISCEMFRFDPGWGLMILIFGVITMFGGALLGIFSINIKRTLACSSMSQIGFILTGIGMQGLLGSANALAARGTMLHMMNHSLIKLVLFMAAGVIYMNLHELDLNRIRGFGRGKWLLTAVFLVGGLSISGIPGFSGYVSKTLLHESIVEYMEEIPAASSYGYFKFIEIVFLVSGGMTLAYMTKLFTAVFIEKGEEGSKEQEEAGAMAVSYDTETEGHRGTYVNLQSAAALALSALVLFVFGICPYRLMDRAASLGTVFMHAGEHGEAVDYFTFSNLKGSLTSIVIGIVIYFLIIRKLLMKKDEEGNTVYIDAWPKWLDMENLIYRPVLEKILPFVLAFVLRIFDRMADHIISLLHRSLLREVEPKRPLMYGNAFTHVLGAVMDKVVELLNRTVRRKSPKVINYEQKLAFGVEGMIKMSRYASRSVSFGLMMFSMGCIFTLVYLIVMLLIHISG
ncbi:MAG: sodium:proton antiporter [Lachnospiraceae bacterium]|nr:sodium:proton antiporter [Lachnospiraceae bacterium]